ncbi:7-alpha-hydroxysteroid dehydrogenase [Actinomycetes bacterium]|nr:7-alpha-hydroxysteroid dehydrogenase [Actinomycetes bacterium]
MILDRFKLTDRVVMITGAGRGIGAGCAQACAEAGAHVALTARTVSQLEEVGGEVRAQGRKALIFPADVNDLDTLEAFVAATIEEFGRIDTVINNAGGSMPAPFMDTSTEMFEKAFHFNVTTAFSLSQHALPHLLETGGSIVNISSTMGRIRERGFVAYGTAKAALAHMTRLMAADCAPRVRVNAIAVGSVATSALEIVLTNEDLRKEMTETTPLRRLGEVQDIAAGVVYLASDAASYITGKILEIDGGLEGANLDLRLPDL